MKITFDHVQDQNLQTEKAQIGLTREKQIGAVGSGQNLSGIAFGKGQDTSAYGKQMKTVQEIKDKAGLLDASDYKNYMAVMASSMSGEDFSKMMEEGVKPGKTEVGDMVTIMDHIKTVMARSGIVIEGFNGGGDIPMEKLEAMAGNAAYAKVIADEFTKNDLPLTEEAISETMKQSNLAMDITGLSDNVKRFLIENGSELTIDQIYMATYSTQAVDNSGLRSSYFADDFNGYYGKTTEMTEMNVLSAQMDKIISEAGLEIKEETKAEASWIIKKGLLLTGDNLEKLHRMNHMEFPVSFEDAVSKIAQALREGKQAKDADLSKDGIFVQAEQIKKMTDEISPEAIKKVMSDGERLNLRNLSNAQRFIDAAMSLHMSAQIQPESKGDAFANMEATFIHAQRTLEEVRLQMTISANVMLLRSDYAIDTTELSKLVEALRAAEQKMSQTQGLSLSDKEGNTLFEDTMAKTTAIRQMPAALLGRVTNLYKQFTLSQVYEEGRVLEATYKKAGETYEALMTSPRADLGDRISDAFSNIDDILEDLQFDLSKDNRKAVRVLAYNHMELTKENIVAVRAADAQLSYLLEKMTPAATLSMIREGIHPLQKSVQELTDYFIAQGESLTEQAESFSQFLYQLEKKNQITEEERESYIGIYRFLRQIEKGDGKAIGRVLANGQELSFANLLSAVRTGQKKGVDVKIDDVFGLLEETQNNGSRISEQIDRYYEVKAAGLLETTWEALMDSGQEEQMQQETQYRQEQLLNLRNQLQTGKETVEYLQSNGQPITPDYLEAAHKLLKKRGEMFRNLSEILEEEEIFADFEQAKEQFTDEVSAKEAYETMQNKVSERLEETMYSAGKGYLDIRAITALSKQLSLAGNLAKEENYELPAMIDGQWTSVNVRMRKETKGESGNSVSIFVQLTGGERIAAEMKIQGEGIFGYIGCDSRNKLEQLERKMGEFIQNLLSETGKKADINIVYSKEVKAYEHNQQAGKPIKSAKDLNQTDRSEELQGRLPSAKELYQTAKAFIAMLEVPA